MTSSNTTSYNLTVTYNDGGTETFTVNAEGKLPRPRRSDSRVLLNLVNFRLNPFTSDLTVSLEDALESPERVIGLHPVFFTTDDAPTTLLAKVTSFEAVTE